MATTLDEGTRDGIQYKALNVIESVLRSLKRTGRVDFWQRADTGFVCDVFWSTRPRRPKEIGFGIYAHVNDDGSVKVTVSRVFTARLVTEPEPSEDDLDTHSLTVDSEGVSDAARQLLDIFVGFPPETARTDE